MKYLHEHPQLLLPSDSSHANTMNIPCLMYQHTTKVLAFLQFHTYHIYNGGLDLGYQYTIWSGYLRKPL